MSGFKHSTKTRIWHWAFAALFAYAVFKQVGDLSDLHDTSLLWFEILFAVAFVLVLLARYVHRKKNFVSALPVTTPSWQRGLAQYVHECMYMSLLITAISGLIMGGLFASGYVFGPWIKGALELHMFAVHMAYLFIGIHVLGALYHRARQDGVWESMVPTRKRR